MDIDYIIERMEEALERQQNEEGEIATTPTVSYCIDCDKISINSFCPDGCIDHRYVTSDGYDHGGIQSAITALKAVNQQPE